MEFTNKIIVNTKMITQKYMNNYSIGYGET